MSANRQLQAASFMIEHSRRSSGKAGPLELTLQDARTTHAGQDGVSF
jgi:hypothetical protein